MAVDVDRIARFTDALVEIALRLLVGEGVLQGIGVSRPTWKRLRSESGDCPWVDSGLAPRQDRNDDP